MRICFLTKYTAAGASSRYRCYQFADSLGRRGHTVDFMYLLSDDYVRRLYSGRRQSFRDVASAYVRRLRDVVRARKYDLVVLQYESFPRLPTLFERVLFVFNRNVVLDIDDAWHAVYADRPLLRSKIAWLMRRSRAVIAGSRVLADHSMKFNRNTMMIPTVVDPSKYKPKPRQPPARQVEIVWIGTPLNAILLHSQQRAWQQLSGRYPNLVFKFIGAGQRFHIEGIRFRIIPWSEETESSEIASADIGIMPLRDDAFARGKCAFKIIQYMASGIPVVASAIGANTDVVMEGETGFLASSERDWVSSISRLIENPDLRQTMGQKGRLRVERFYSIEAVWPLIEDTYAKVVGIDKEYELREPVR